MEKINLYPFTSYVDQQDTNTHDGELDFIERLSEAIYKLLLDPTNIGSEFSAKKNNAPLSWNRMIFNDENFYNVLITYDDSNCCRLANVNSLPKVTPEQLNQDFVDYFSGLLKLKGIKNIDLDSDSTRINPGFDKSSLVTTAQIALKVNLPKSASVSDKHVNTTLANQDKDTDK